MKPFLFIFFTLFLLKSCLSALLMGLTDRNSLSEIYTIMRKEGIYMLSALSIKDEEAAHLCNDILGSNTLKKYGVHLEDIKDPKFREAVEKLSDADRAKYFQDGNIEGERLYPLNILKIVVPNSSNDETAEPQWHNLGEDITKECLVLESTEGAVSTAVYLLSYAFRKRSFFISKKVPDGGQLLALADLSPESEIFDLKALEQYYLKYREPLENVGNSWPDLKKAYELFDNLSVLTTEEITLLCASIFEAPYYKDQSITFAGHAPEQEGTSRIKKELHFETSESGRQGKPLTTDNFVCQGKKDDDLNTELKYYITRSLNTEHSVFVQRTKGDALVLDSYVKNIALLIHTASRPVITIERN